MYIELDIKRSLNLKNLVIDFFMRKTRKHVFNLLSAELIFLFSSYSAYLIARFAFFSVSIIFATAKFCGKVPDGQFQFAGAKFCVEIFDEVYNCCSFCTRCVGMVKIKIKAHDIESRSF